MTEKRRYPRDAFYPVVDAVERWADEADLRVVVCGSWRRMSPMVADLDVVVMTPRLDRVELPDTFAPDRSGPDLAQGLLFVDDFSALTAARVDFWACPSRSRGVMLTYATGPKALNVHMRSKAKSMGMTLSQLALENRAGKRLYPTERALFALLDVEWVPPSRRDDWASLSGASVLEGEHEFTGASGDLYRMVVSDGRPVSCTCKGFEHRGTCKHVKDPEHWVGGAA